MSTTSSSVGARQSSPAGVIFQNAYRLFAYFGLFSLAGSLIWGFRYDPTAPAGNFAFNAMLYAIFIVPHLVMTRSWFKKAVWRNPVGHPIERRFYITVTVVTWLGILWFQRPLSGAQFAAPEALQFAGLVVALLGMMMFFEGVTRPMLDGLLGVPGAGSAFSHGPETPLFTEGQYGEVRHPMYRAFVIMAAGSLIMHPNAAQLAWAAALLLTFIAFIPVEEAQMIRARGDDYRDYMAQTRYRLIRGVW